MALRGVCFEIATKCPSCSEPLALNGANESVLCASCQKVVSVPPEIWQSILGDSISEALGMGEDDGRNSTMILAQGFTVQMLYGRQFPRCSNDSCKTSYPEEALRAGIDDGRTELKCSRCGQVDTMRKPPPWFGDVHTMVALLVREQVVSASGKGKATGAQAIPVHCYHCGGSLDLDGKERKVQCPYCKQYMVIPDEIWARMHPAQEKARWYAVVDAGGAAGVIPAETDDFTGIAACAAEHEFFAIYHASDEGDAGHPCRIVRCDRDGRLKWLQDGVEFSDYPDTNIVRGAGDGNLWIADAENHFLRLIDGDSGEPIRTIETSTDSEDAERIDLEDGAITADLDGTLLHAGSLGLRRFDSQGKLVPTWKPDGKIKAGDGYVDFADLKDETRGLPEDAMLCVGWDGLLYVIDAAAQMLAIYERNGKLRSVADVGGLPIEDLNDIGIDNQGVIYALFDNSEALGDTNYPHLGRCKPGKRFELWLGPQGEKDKVFLGEYSDRLAVFPDGVTMVGNGFDDLRRISADGEIIWRSPGTRAAEKSQLEDLAKKRKGKKKAKDRE